MDDDQVADIPLPLRRRSYRLTGQSNTNAVKKNQTEVQDVQNENDVVDQPKNPRHVFKRQLDNSGDDGGGQVETAVDCSSQRKKTKTAAEVKDPKNGKDGLKKVTQEMTSANCSSSFPSPEKPVKNLTTCEVEQMQHIQSVMDELKDVPDITEMIKDSDSNKMPRNSDCSSSSAPAMVSEGMGGRFQTVDFYWLDMLEEPEHPGMLFIFGKVKSPTPGNGYSSGCIVVKNLNRRVFLLPRDTKADGTPVDYMDVYNEFYTVFAPQLKLPWFQCKRSKRMYCFDIEGIPPEAEYMEVRYSGTAPALPQGVNGETFSHAFGTNTSLMETFLLEKKLKGPCWLQLAYCERVRPDKQQSWSKFEFTCDVSTLKIHPESSKFPVPTLVLASIQTETVYDTDLKRNAFIFAGVAVHGNVNLQLPSPPTEICQDFFCLINTPSGQTWPAGFERITNKRILKMDSESSMLECLVNKLHEIDADMYLDYGTDLSRLLNQLSDLKVPNWSRIGRLKRSKPLPVTKGNSHFAIPGRLLCDMTTSKMPRWRTTHIKIREKRNGKQHVASSLAGSEMRALYKSCEDLESLVKWGMKHCVLKIREMRELQVLPLAFQASFLSGGTLALVLLGNFGRRSEYLMLHALSAKDYIVPDDYQFLRNNLQKGVAAESKVVLELSSEKSFYDNYILQLRFFSHSLYHHALQGFQFVLSNDADDGAKEPRRSIQNELWKLGQRQKQVRSLMEMKDVTVDQMRQYEVQMGALTKMTSELKVAACADWRFCSKTLKAYIKAQIRDMLVKVKEIVSKMGYEVIYGSESCVMIQTQSPEISTVLEIGKKIKNEIRRTYPVLSVCSYVRIYRRLLLLKNNKYAGILQEGEADLEHFTMDAPGEMPIIVFKTARACLLEILSEQPLRDKINQVGKILREVGRRLRDGAVSFEELGIRQTLTKDPEEYENTHGLHHVTVALRMNKILKNIFRKGNQVSYVFCTDGRPRHLTEMESIGDKETNEKADADYYLAKMILPVLTEICERIPGLGLDSNGVADALGVGGCSL